ncbi:Protein CBG26994 [Caenorhabditis briggsae]|uniref:Protein CBG26994 n=1 Tax=Caenorhabditis briggsae TaxID=6238 RepID=B6IEW0_CAEBR|nr:Protein CBG26994 [Caenorhabditis briggsae]CAR98440.1 Protein CBG26994 [Caenorhabditis briggsae]
MDSRLKVQLDSFKKKYSSLTVTNLSPTSSKDDLWSIFMSTGDINSIAMNKDVAIIDYMDSEAAGKAVRRLNHVEFDGRTLTVTNA